MSFPVQSAAKALAYRPVFYDDDPDPWFIRDRWEDVPWPKRIANSVLFVGTRDKGKFVPRATAFRVVYQQGGLGFGHVVTAEHVISGLLSRGHEVWIRANMEHGGSGEFAIPPDAFYYHPDDSTQTDVAVCPLGDYLVFENGERHRMDVANIAINGAKNIAATDDIIAERQIGIGDEIGVVGLFRSHYGRELNIPVLRTGNIAAMRGEPVHTEYAGYTDAYIVEARSIGGLSGSPVFVSMVGHRLLEGSKTDDGHGRPAFYLLGLMHGHFDVKHLNEDVVQDDQNNALGSINTGMGVVIPVQKIIETVEQPDLVKKRDEEVAAKRAATGAKADLALGDEAPPATDANPIHREDFTRLLGAAARKPPQED